MDFFALKISIHLSAVSPSHSIQDPGFWVSVFNLFAGYWLDGNFMAPAVIEVVAGSAAKEFKKESATARLLGSGTQAELHRTSKTDFCRFRWYC